MVDVKKIRESICSMGKIMYEKGITDSSGGNMSVRDKNLVYINPRRAGQDFQWNIDPDSIIVTDLCKVPVIGEVDSISREAATHYAIYQNFPDVGAVLHGHPIFIMAFGAAHMDIPAVSEGTRAVVGLQPITCTEEVVPSSEEQAAEVVNNFKRRREIDPDCALICNIPYHGTFAAGATLNDAFVITEVANNCAKILIYRQMMFGNDPKADFSIHKQFTKEDFAMIDVTREVCQPGQIYTGPDGKKIAYKNESALLGNDYEGIVRRVTDEVLNNLKARQNR